MKLKRVLIPVLMLAVCGAILGVYNFAVVDNSTPLVTPSTEPTSDPSPTARSNPTPARPPTPSTDAAIPAIGDQAPDFILPSVWGDPVTLSSYRGQENIVLVFYRTGG
jgi:hypothetical protein